MVKKVDSQALGIVNKALGLTGAGAPDTEFLDGVVDQVLPVGELIRRGRVLAGTDGIFTPTLRVNLSGAATDGTTVDPYRIGTTNRVAPYPAIVPNSLDVWLLGASVRQVSGTGTLNGVLSITVTTTQQGFGQDNAGLLVLVDQRIRLAFWDAIGSDGSNFGILNELGTHKRLGIRLPRSTTEILFRVTSSATSSWDCQLVLGLFPVALGQDVVV